MENQNNIFDFLRKMREAQERAIADGRTEMVANPLLEALKAKSKLVNEDKNTRRKKPIKKEK